jgi:hypothetical protein
MLSKVAKALSGNSSFNFQGPSTQSNPSDTPSGTNSQRTSPNPQQNGLYASLFNDKTVHGRTTIIQPPKPSKKQLEAKKKQQKRDRRLILIKESMETFENVNSLEIRTKINQELTIERHTLSPVISTITKSLTKNLIITTTDDYTAEFLLEHVDILARHLKFKEAKRDIAFHKVVCHGVSLQFDREDMPELIKTELATFNKSLNLNVVGKPYWLTSEEKRRSGQRAGSLVIAFATEEEATRARRNRLNIGGNSARVEILHAVLPTTQCSNCCGYGHLQQRCPKSSKCKFCAQNHHTREHSCDTCQTTGMHCTHTQSKCINCGEKHTADSSQCQARPIQHPEC